MDAIRVTSRVLVVGGIVAAAAVFAVGSADRSTKAAVVALPVPPPPPEPVVVAPLPAPTPANLQIPVTAVHARIAGDYVYWNQASQETGTLDDPPALYHLLRAPLAGGKPELIATDVRWAFTVSGDHVFYVASPADTIRRVALDGSDNELVARSPSEPVSIAVGGGYVYWTTERGAMRAPAAGGKAIRVAEGRGWDSLAADDNFLYIAGHELTRIPHGEKRATILAAWGDQADDVALTRDSVVVAVDAHLLAISKEGGPLRTLAVGGDANSLTATADAVYWTTWGNAHAQALYSCASGDVGTVFRVDPELCTVETIAQSCTVRDVTVGARVSFLVENPGLVKRDAACSDAAYVGRHAAFEYAIEGGSSRANAMHAGESAYADVMNRCTRDQWSASAISAYQPPRE